MIKLTNKEIIDIIFKIGEESFTDDEIDFWKRLDAEREKRNYPWKTGSAYDNIAIGIYIGIKYAEKYYNKEK